MNPDSTIVYKTYKIVNTFKKCIVLNKNNNTN